LEALRERALANLRALPRPHWEPVGNGLFRLVSEVTYEESLLLVDPIFDSLKVRGNPVVAIPNRGVLLAAGGQEPAAIAALIEQAQHSMGSAPWPLSGTLLERTANGWQLFQLPADLAASARALQTISLAITYHDQGEALQQHCNKIGDDVYVASFSTLRPDRDSPIIHSWCSWGQGIVSLLPRTDLIGLTKTLEAAEPETLMVSWDEVERICAHHLRDTEEDPARYRVEGFPSESEWQQLKLSAVQRF
jgi:hypothetical protein